MRSPGPPPTPLPPIRIHPPGGGSLRRSSEVSPEGPSGADAGRVAPLTPEDFPVNRALLQLLGLSLLALMALLVLECPGRGRRASVDGAPGVQLIAATRGRP